MIDLISFLIAITVLLVIIGFGSFLLYSTSCFTSYCKEIADYFVTVSTSSYGLADWDDEY